MSSQNHTQSDNRVIAFDVMRAAMLLLLVVFHSGVSFMKTAIHPELWLYKDAQTSVIFDGVLSFIHTFRHPAFFFISGFVTQQMFFKYSNQAVFLKRFKRIFLPMIITILFMGPIINMQLAILMGKTDVFNFQTMYPITEYTQFRVTTIFVWFLYYLMIFSILQWFLRWRKWNFTWGKREINTANFSFILLLITVLLIACLLLWGENSLFGQYHLLPSLGSLGGYYVFYSTGAFFARSKNGLAFLNEKSWILVAGGTVFFIVYTMIGWVNLKNGKSPMILDLPILISSSLASVFYSFGILGLAVKYYTKSNKWVAYISKSSYFLYLSHFPLLLVFLNVVVEYNWNVFLKFIVVFVATLVSAAILNVIWLKAWKNKPPI